MPDLELEDEDKPPKPTEEDPPPPAETKPKEPGKIQVNPLMYGGQTGAVYKIWFLNLLMNIITVGIYRFWGKTRMRKYTTGSFTLGGDRFEYTGNGLELFIGFLKAIPVFLLIYAPFVVATIIAGEEAAWPAVFLIPIIFFFYMARYMSMRYRVGRTTWRGIRAIMDGSAVKYGIFAMKRLFLNLISLGILVPYSDVLKHRYMVETLYFGNTPVDFEGSGGSLMKTHLVTLLLAVPTLGLSRIWYKAALMRLKISGMRAGDIRFKNNVTGGNLFGLTFGNLLIIIFTLGIGMPVVIQRNMRFFARHNRIGGDLDTSEVLQAKNQKAGVAEGIEDVFDFDTGFM